MVVAADPTRGGHDTWESTQAGLGSSLEEHAAKSVDGPVRFEDLVERCMGNIELATRLLDQSQTHLAQDLDTLRQCDQKADSDEFVKVAHRLKGATANLGAYQLSEVFARLEQHGRAGAATVQDCLPELETEWARFTECVAELSTNRKWASAVSVGERP